MARMTQPRVTQVRVDVDGYPTVCARCGLPIVKKHHDSQHHHQAGTSTSWHTTCTTAARSPSRGCPPAPAESSRAQGRG
jgi:hypothetical protein